MSKVIGIVAAVMAVYCGVAYAIATLLHLKGSSFWVLIGSLIAIGLLASAAYLFFEKKKRDAQKRADNPQPDASGPVDELAQILREAEQKLQTSQLGPNARYSSLPVIFVVGAAGSTKTTTMVHSGIDPELLAGQVYQDNNVAPTRSANLWYARQTVFIEPGDAVFADQSKWVRLIRRMQPGKLSAVRKGEQAPRAAVVCFSCETFLQPGATEAVANAARMLQGKLTEISRQLGIALPVYVLFTKADRVSFFHDYVHMLTNDEVTQVFGATLPLAGASKGVYAEEQAARLTEAFNGLYISLCNRRLDFLPRENDPERLPGAYEFPRELRKARTPIVQFLVDVCRPSELTAAPFLRGFYFCGVRPIFVREAVAAPAKRPVAGAFQPASGATGIFRLGPGGAQQQGPAPEMAEARKVPQWVFLNHFFNGVLLADHAALASSVTSVKTNALRRFLLATAGGLCLLYLVLATISFFHNRSLIGEVRSAAAGIAPVSGAPGAIPDITSLRQLDKLRVALEKVARYNNEGAPLSYRWGLYAGHDLYDKAKALYFDRFNKMLFGSTQGALLGAITRLPAAPPGDSDAAAGASSGACVASGGAKAEVAPVDPHTTFGYVYDTLKAYLVTTSNPEHAASDLPPVLYAHWSEGKSGIDDETAQLARNQFSFYTYALENSDNPYPELKARRNDEAVGKGRNYLGLFKGIGPVYHWMLSDASQGLKSARFQQQIPGTQVVFAGYEVPAAYTKPGWAKMQDEIKNIGKYTKAGGDWVMGSQAAAGPDPASIQSAVSTRYQADYVAQWRQYLCQAHVVGYGGIKDAAEKLAVLKRPDSPLLSALCIESQNTDAPELASAFTAVHSVVATSCSGNLIGAGNTEYMTGLGNLQFDLSQINGPPDPNDPNVAAANTHEQATKNLVDVTMLQKFGLDPQAGVVQILLEKPLTNVEPFIKGLGAAALNAKAGAELCRPFSAMMSKYPFNPRDSGAGATLDDLNNLLKPNDGALWRFYEQNLKTLLPKSGSQYTATPASGVTLTAGFVAFFNRAADFSNMLYAGGPAPQVKYSLKPIASEGSQDATLTIDGQTLSFQGAPAAKPFTWPGSQQGVSGKGKFAGTDVPWADNPGLWGLFRFFGSGQRQGSGLYEWPVLVTLGGHSTKIGALRLQVDPANFPPQFPALTCPAGGIAKQ